MKNIIRYPICSLLLVVILLSGCSEDDLPGLEVPDSYISNSYDANVSSEAAVIDELSIMTLAANEAESNAQNTTVSSIPYPSGLSTVTLSSYRTLVRDWLVELVNAANDNDGFINPGDGEPIDDEEGGLLGNRLLDEYGLELEQMIQKGSFGAALYNHALTVINGDLSNSSAIDKLVEIHGTTPTFDPSGTTAAATYSRRRSNQTTETGFFYDIRNSLITAKAAIDAGEAFETQRDEALSAYLEAWEKSNFATVIFYCQATVDQLSAAQQLEEGVEKDKALGDAMHAYAEGVAFAHGFRGISNKIITDQEIDALLELFLAPAGEKPESYRFLNDASLLGNFDGAINLIQNIYGFTDEEVATFFINDPT